MLRLSKTRQEGFGFLEILFGIFLLNILFSGISLAQIKILRQRNILQQTTPPIGAKITSCQELSPNGYSILSCNSGDSKKELFIFN